MTPEESIISQIAKGTIEVSRLNCDYEDCESLGGSSPDHITVTVANRLTRVVARVSITARISVPKGHYIASARSDAIFWEKGHDYVWLSSMVECQDPITDVIRPAVADQLTSGVRSEFRDLSFCYHVNNVAMCADSDGLLLIVQMDIEAD